MNKDILYTVYVVLILLKTHGEATTQDKRVLRMISEMIDVKKHSDVAKKMLLKLNSMDEKEQNESI